MESIKIHGYSVGDNSVGIPISEFSLDLGIVEITNEDKEFIIKGIIRDLHELHDNGDLRFNFSDEIKEKGDEIMWDYSRRFTY